MKVYLCGPINGCTDEECNDWRVLIRSLLGGCEIVDPMRRDYRGREQECWREIVELDKIDVAQCDIVAANAPKPSVGTSMEIFLAWQFAKPIVVITPNPTPSPWLIYHATKIVRTYADAAEWIRTWAT